MFIKEYTDLNSMICPVCKASDFKKVPFINEVSKYTKISYPLFKCRGCGLIRPNPLPYNDENKDTIYDEADNIKFYKNGKIDENSYEYQYYFKHFKPYLELVKKYGKGGSCLDVGCGAGHLMELLDKNGLYVEGLEVTEKLAKALGKKI